MRMKFNKSSQLVLVSAASLLAAGLVTACGTLTADFVFVTSAKAAGPNSYGEVNVFEVNSESGFMRQIPTSPFPSGGRNPVAEAVSPDETTLYVVNQDDNTIVQFTIGNDGKLYPQNTLNTPGVFPLAVAVTGNYLYVADTYQPLAYMLHGGAVFRLRGRLSDFDRRPGKSPNPVTAPGYIGVARHQFKHQRELLAARSAGLPHSRADAHRDHHRVIGRLRLRDCFRRHRRRWLCIRLYGQLRRDARGDGRITFRSRSTPFRDHRGP